MRRAVLLLQYGLVRLAELYVRALTPAALPGVARRAGALWYALDGRRRRRALENLRVAFGASLDEGARAALAEASFGELLRVPLEVLAQPRFLTSVRSLSRSWSAHGDYELFRADVAARRGGILVTGHLGNWEMAARSLVITGVPSSVVMRPLENPYLDASVVKARGGGARVILKGGAARAVARVVAGGAWAGILADQNAGRGGVFVPFFGLAASSHPLPAALALRLGVPLYACACLRSARGPWAFELHFRRILDGAGPQEHGKADVVGVLGRVHAALEGWVRAHPAQYNWLHRRWKSRPPGEAPGPHLPSYAAPSQQSQPTVLSQDQS